MLHHLERQQALNELYHLPDLPSLLPDILTALDAELGEVKTELKSWWAWWTDRPVNRAQLLQELADVQFFYLIFVLHARKYQHGFNLDGFASHAAFLTARGERHGAAFAAHPSSTELGGNREVIAHINGLQHHVLAGESRPYETLFILAEGIAKLTAMLGFSQDDLEEAYLEKFLVNIQRTGKLHTDEGTALYLAAEEEQRVVRARRRQRELSTFAEPVRLVA